ncbi:related to 26S proteasome regulatory subunit RPN3 [Saccharomycodes ludwigii]|uniref:Related to 26S proteasome regulatory subunit RPN3 n=1 Tax=Saccharomycodes ludwigii TaxID=36035 RepID=A0A376B504_9ASCO|nr:hypothetical protein SCDLUD_000057 [Saccharomycodes ludwigii]KAH3902480.1 hypothetical protein SCDLUD_000057 [Saccharomycodes ludwigii]SSD59702.1 related to 26S proteasome regulatory subunit RPN3 [Saccharomycodes ludwigii]
MTTSDPMEIDSKGELQEEHVSTNAEVVDLLVNLCREISKSTATLDSRYIWKALRQIPLFRTKLNKENLTIFINVLYPDTSSFKRKLLQTLTSQKTNVVESEELREQYPVGFYTLSINDNVEVSSELNSFVHLLVQLYLLKENELAKLQEFNLKVVIPKILKFYDNRMLDLINSKLWFYIARTNELFENPNQKSIRYEMIKFLRIATLKHDIETQAQLITCILRDFLIDGEVSLAGDFISKIDFPSTNHHQVSSPLEARYFYYLSRINAIQLDYSAAHEYIIAAIRKAPNSISSLGFLQQANKLRCCIELLMGDIPELSFFHQKSMEKSLYSYYLLSKAVKTGNLHKFQEIIHKFKQQLVYDNTYQLCVRLRSNVIKTGIRIISLTYKKISLKDICLKLHLDSEQSAEYMVSRAIRDGVIEAKIDYEKGLVETSEVLNVYDTNEPKTVFNERIKFVTQLNDECVRSMRYPEKDSDDKKNGAKKGDEDDDKANGDNVESLEDLLAELSDFDDDDFDDAF